MRKFLAFLLALLVAIPMLAAAFFLISIQSWALDREFYKKALSGDEVFSALEVAISADAFKDMDMGGVKVDNRALGKALFAALPREEIRKDVLRVVDTAFDAFEGKSKARELSLDGKRLASVLEKNAKIFSKAYAEALPEGTSPAFDAADLAFRPKGMSAPAFAAKIQPIVDQGVAVAAGKIREMKGVHIPDPAASGVPYGGNVIKAARFAFVGVLVAAAIVLMLGFLLWPKPWSGRFAYLGVTILVGSISCVLIGVVGGILFNLENIRAAAGAAGWSLPMEALTPELRGYLLELVGAMTRSFFITGIIGASAGAGILSLRWVAAAREI